MTQDERILHTAAEWFDRLRHEHLPPEQVAAWQRWIGEDDEHRKAFDRLQDAWQRFENVPMPPLATAAKRMADPYCGDVPLSDWIEPAIPASQFRGLRSPVRLAAAVALAVICGGVLWRYLPVAGTNEVSAFETHAAEHRDVRLADGTKVSVGAKSLVWVRFQPAMREIVLDRGEAYFDVAKDARRPFVVRAGSASITAVGTAFNVRKTGTRVQVVVAEGAVNVNPDTVAPALSTSAAAAQPTRLQAGHRWTADPAVRTTNVSRAAPESALAWRTGRLEYVGEPLKYVVADVNRYSKMEISIADPRLGELPVTGTVFEDDIDGWLKSIEQFIPVRVQHADGDRVVLHARASD